MPVLANGNIRTLQDVHDCMAYTGAAGVMSAETLLEDPALFAAPHPGVPVGLGSERLDPAPASLPGSPCHPLCLCSSASGCTARLHSHAMEQPDCAVQLQLGLCGPQYALKPAG